MNKDLTVGRPDSVLWRFCLPLLGSVIFQQLYNIADSLIAGKYAGVDALAAVGNSYEITLIYLAFAFGCNMGCSVIVAQFFGAKNYRDMKTAVYTTFISSAILCVVLMLAGFFAGGSLLSLINTPTHLMADSKLYLDIYTGGLLFLFFYNIATGIFSALGDSKTPFIFLAISSVANVFVDILFVRNFDMGVAGVAWATFICQGASCLFSLVVVVKRLRGITEEEKIDGENKNSKPAIFSWSIYRKILAIAIPSTLQQGFVSIGNIIIQGIINNYGAGIMAGYAAAIKLNNMIITTYTSLGNGMSNFTAQNVGANKTERLGAGLKAGLKLVYILSAIVVAVYMLFTSQLVNLFMDATDENVASALACGVEFLHIVVPFYFVVSTKITCDGILRGTGAMKQFMIATFSDLILRVGLAYLFSKSMGSTGIWRAWPVGWFIGTVISIIFTVCLLRRICEKKDIKE